MAINFTDFSRAPLQDSPFKDLMENALKGYQIGRAPAQIAQAEKQQLLTNQLKSLEAEHAPKKYEQTEEYNRLANALQSEALKRLPKKYQMEESLNEARINKLKNPAAAKSLNPNAAVANAEYIWRLKNPTGDITPEQQKSHIDFLTKAFETGQEHTAAGTENTKGLNDTRNERLARSPIAKMDYEIDQIDKGYVPYTEEKEKITSEHASRLRNNLMMKTAKDVSDPNTRKQLVNATNMNITLDSINPTTLSQFSGGEGAINKIAERSLATLGAESPEWKGYKLEAAKASAAAKQMRLYLGDSIQPAQQNRLEHLTNPESWDISPETAKQNFEFMRDLMKRESNTLLRAVNDPTIFYPKNSFGGEQTQATSTSGQKFDWNKYPVAGKNNG